MSKSGFDQVLICPGSGFDQFWIMSESGLDQVLICLGSGSDQVRISSGSCVNQVLICSRSGLSLVWIRSRLGSDQFRIRSRLGSEKVWIKFNFKIIIVSLMQIFDKKVSSKMFQNIISFEFIVSTYELFSSTLKTNLQIFFARKWKDKDWGCASTSKA